MTPLAEQTRWMDATEQAALVRRGDVHPSELVEAAIERVELLNPVINAIVTHMHDAARSAAAAPDLPSGPFRGVPFLVKDLWAMNAGVRMTNGVRALAAADHRAPYDTTLVQRHRAAGLVTIGRTNTPELGLLPTTEPLAFGATRNPWALDRSPGGSSGGSAAAVAAGIVPAAHASDGGGSIRIPASCCGLVGLKVSQGRITLGPDRSESALGVEHVVCRTVRDAAALLDATHGPGIGDAVIAPTPVRPFADEVGAPPGRLRIGLFLGTSSRPAGPDAAAAATAAAELLESLGHHVEPACPDALLDDGFAAVFTALWAAQTRAGVLTAGRWLGRELGPDDVEPLTWALAERARAVTADDYVQALAAASVFRRRVQQWWADGWDLLLTPTVSGPAPLLGEMAQDAGRPFAPFARSGEFATFTPAFNTSGQPAISLPTHWTDAGLPVGVQLVAAYGREDVLLRVAASVEDAVRWAERRPPPLV